MKKTYEIFIEAAKKAFTGDVTNKELYGFGQELTVKVPWSKIKVFKTGKNIWNFHHDEKPVEQESTESADLTKEETEALAVDTKTSKQRKAKNTPKVVKKSIPTPKETFNNPVFIVLNVNDVHIFDVKETFGSAFDSAEKVVIHGCSEISKSEALKIINRIGFVDIHCANAVNFKARIVKKELTV